MKFGTGENRAKRVMPGMSTWVNLLDYSASVLPVMLADKSVDVIDEGYVAMNGQDEKIFQACEFHILSW